MIPKAVPVVSMSPEFRARGDKVKNWQTLTTDAKKIALYSNEHYFREASSDLSNYLSRGKLSVLHRTCAMIIKPGAIASNNVDVIVSYLEEHKFQPLFFRKIHLSRYVCREIWRYQWNVATVDRIAVSDLLFTATESLWIVLKDISQQIEIPASVRLSSLKGSPQLVERSEGDLRSVLRSPNRLLTFVHVPDEPADMIRELGVIFDREERCKLLTELFHDEDHGGVTLEVIDTAHTMSNALGGPIHFDAGSVIERVKRRIATAEREQSSCPPLTNARAGALVNLRQHLDRLAAGGSLDWIPFNHALSASGINLNIWDRISLGSQWITHDELGQKPILDDTGRDGWYTGHGILVK